MPTEPITWTAILTWIISGLLVVSAFFLVRFFNTHDENMKENSTILKGIMEKLERINVTQAVHSEKHDHHDERLDRLEGRRKKS